MLDLSNVIFYGCYLFLWVVFVWEFYLSIRQYRKYRDTVECPGDVKHYVDEETFQKSRLYKLDKARFGFAVDIWGQIENTVTLTCGLLPIFWDISGHIMTSWGLNSEIWQSIIFLTTVTILGKIINMPWSVYDTFVIEQKHGFNKQTASFFVKDQIKGMVLQLLIGMPIMAGIIAILRSTGYYAFIITWAFISTVIFFLMTIYPEFIAPLFDKYTPLPDGELRTKIEALASKLEYPLKKLYVVEGSKRSAHSNAYLYGLGKNKRIVLYDTLLASHSPLNKSADDTDKPVDEETKNVDAEPADAVRNNDGEIKEKATAKSKGVGDDEVVAIIGHELGHWKLNHNIFNIIITEANLFLCLGVFALLHNQPVIYKAFGFENSQPMLIGLMIIFEFIFAPYNELLSFIMTALTRRMEFQADRFSAELGYSSLLQTALMKLEKDNLSFPVHDWLYSMWHYSHPPTAERVEVLKKME